MAGPAFYFQALRRTIDALQAGSAADQARAAVLQTHSAWAHLGALGPDLLRYTLPDAALFDSINAPGGFMSLSADEKVQISRRPLMVCYGMLYRNLVLDVWPFLQKLHDFYDQLEGIAAAEDATALAGLEDEFNDIQASAATLTGLAPKAEALRSEVIGPAIILAKPVIQTSVPLAVKQWRAFEFLRWVRPAQFARNLLTLASGEGDPTTREQLIAYAHGYMCHVATATTGEPFVDSIVGGPYRTHWWRNRYVGNYVDSWAHGRYETPGTMAGDNPTPAYSQWKSICEAKLHEQIAFSAPAPAGFDVAKEISAGTGLGGATLPGAIVDLLLEAVDQTYQFSVDITPDELRDGDTYRDAYAGLYSVLWLMTGSEGPLCPRPPAGPPSTCTEEPTWVSGGGSPPAPVKKTPGDTGSAVVLAILAILLLLTGNWAAGAAAIAGAIAAAKGGAAVDWAQLRCNLYWQRHTIFEIEQGIRDALIVAGLAYPMAHQLGDVDTSGNTIPTDGINDSGSPLTRVVGKDRYPHLMDNSVASAPDLNWLNPPATGYEQPHTHDLQDHAAYADHVLTGQGVLNGGELTDGAFPTRDLQFGGAVANAADVIRADGVGLADYNLDGDRGYGWKSWRPKLGNQPKDGTVDEEPIL